MSDNLDNFLDSILDENRDVERFKTVKGFPNYIVSNMGYVINKTSGKELKLRKRKDRYGRITLTVGLCRSYDDIKEKSIGNLVAMHFIPNPNNSKKIRYKDKDYTNNKSNNIEWEAKKK